MKERMSGFADKDSFEWEIYVKAGEAYDNAWEAAYEKAWEAFNARGAGEAYVKVREALVKAREAFDNAWDEVYDNAMNEKEEGMI